jgi:hypothetical protein
MSFLQDVKRYPVLAGRRLPSRWIKQHYPLSVPFKDFAKELSKLMQRKREDVCRDGRRSTVTYYVVPPANVVPMGPR